MSYELHLGDCREVMAAMPANSVDSIVCDPPYMLNFMGKAFDKPKDNPAASVEVWAEALRVAKPGAYLLAFGGDRTHHRLMVAIEDAGWQLKTCLYWIFGSGFPKSTDISKQLDKAAGAEREKVRTPTTPHSTAGKGISNELDDRPWLTEARKKGYHEHAGPMPITDEAKQFSGYGTALKPAAEIIVMAMKPVENGYANNALVHGVAGLAIDQCRIGTDEVKTDTPYLYKGNNGNSMGAASERLRTNGGGTTHPQGRWPANLILDEAAAALLDEQSGERPTGKPTAGSTPSTANAYGQYAQRSLNGGGDTGGASRYFQVIKDDEEQLRFAYVAKASSSERNEGLQGMPKKFMATMGDGIGAREHNENQPSAHVRNFHPTVKPIELMRWLCRLTKTPWGGVVLDPFAGSGSTGVAAILEGRSFIGIDTEAEYLAIAEARLAAASAQPFLFDVELP